MIVVSIWAVRTSWSKRDGGEGVGTGKKEEKCAVKVGSSWGRSGRRAVGRRGEEAQGGAERESWRGWWSEEELEVSMWQERRGRDWVREGVMSA